MFFQPHAIAQDTFVLPTANRPAVETLTPAPKEHPTKDEEARGKKPALEAPLSPMERFFAQVSGQADGTLRQFGYELFASEDLAGNALSSTTAVPQNYPLGPGDELVINVPFSTQEIRAIVGREGTIFIPNFGTLSVVGMTLEQFQSSLRSRARGSQLTVRLGKLRTLTVYLSGQVKRPGSYTVSALSTITTLLQAAGGVSRNGSLRSIQLRRSGRVADSFDFYEFLLKGKNSGNLRLEAGDIVFVPSIGAQVALAGNVKQPAIYELKPGTTLSEALELGGGLLAQAYTQRIQLQRVVPNSGREVRTLDLSSPAVEKLKLQDGDLVAVSGGLDRIENGVTLKGNVERPGLYEIKPGMRVSQVIGPLIELKPESYFEYAQIAREVGTDRHLEILPFDLGKALAGDPVNDLGLKPRDTVTIYALSEFQDLPEVQISGAVLRPGKYRLYSRMTLSELINQAGGLRPEADRDFAELTRLQVVDNQTKTTRFSFAPSRAIAKQPKDNLVLSKDDIVQIKTAANYHPTWTFELTGEVAHPGLYTILEGETLASAIERAGGYTRRAYLPGAVFTREAVRILQQEQLATLADRLEQSIIASGASNKQSVESLAAQRELVVKLRKTQATGRIVIQLNTPEVMRQQRDDLQLNAGDRLFVPPINETVSVLGAVYSPNSLMHDAGWTVGDYLRAAGGSTNQGDPDNLYVVRADGQVHSLQNYREGWWIFSRNLMASHLNPGDTVVVPERIDWGNPWVDASTIAQGFAQILTSGVLLYNAVK